MKTKTIEWAQCPNKTTFRGEEVRCILRKNHAGKCLGTVNWNPEEPQGEFCPEHPDTELVKYCPEEVHTG